MESNTTDEKAELISLTENIQRNDMTNADKVRSYTKFLDLSGKDVKWLANVVSVSVSTIKKYIKLNDLPNNILEKLDAKGDERLPKDIGIALVDLPENYDKEETFKEIKRSGIKSKDAIKILKEITKNGGDVKEKLTEFVAQEIEQDTKPIISTPWIYHPETKTAYPIPDHLLKQVQKLVFENLHPKLVIHTPPLESKTPNLHISNNNETQPYSKFQPLTIEIEHEPNISSILIIEETFESKQNNVLNSDNNNVDIINAKQNNGLNPNKNIVLNSDKNIVLNSDKNIVLNSDKNIVDVINTEQNNVLNSYKNDNADINIKQNTVNIVDTEQNKFDEREQDDFVNIRECDDVFI